MILPVALAVFINKPHMRGLNASSMLMLSLHIKILGFQSAQSTVTVTVARSSESAPVVKGESCGVYVNGSTSSFARIVSFTSDVLNVNSFASRTGDGLESTSVHPLSSFSVISMLVILTEAFDLFVIEALEAVVTTPAESIYRKRRGNNDIETQRFNLSNSTDISCTTCCCNLL